MKVFGIAAPNAPAEEIEIETPELSGASVLLRVTNSGVCHSDLHAREGHFDLGDAGQLPLTVAQYPFVPGHEIVGQVVEAGPDATVAPGEQKYIVFPWIGCGECQACRGTARTTVPEPNRTSRSRSRAASPARSGYRTPATSSRWESWTRPGPPRSRAPA